MNLKKIAPYANIAAIAIGLITFLIYKHITDLEQIKAAYVTEKQKETEAIAVKIENSFSSFYQGLRTMSLLPGVKEIDRYGTSFELNSKKAMQQIYNNTYLNVTLSEVYLLPPSLDPDKVDPNTGTPEAPILTFDEFIIGGGGLATDADQLAADKPKEVEIYEYRLMKKQLEYLSANFSLKSSFKDLDVPAVTGEPVITCDNSEFSKTDLQSGNDKPRMGVVYTLPVYNNEGRFSGGISGASLSKSKIMAKVSTGTKSAKKRSNLASPIQLLQIWNHVYLPMDLQQKIL